MTVAALSTETRQKTLERFDQHRRAWRDNRALRTLYARWYGLVREALPPPALGPWIEIGSGPGFAKDFIPGLELTDIVKAPWHARELSAEELPLEADSIGALVLFDVLHHLTSPARFFAQATRVLRRAGRIVLCEPFVSWLSSPVYRLLHDESLDMSADPLADGAASDKDPFSANQAIPTLLLDRGRARFEAAFPVLKVLRVQRLAGLSYPASGGFSRAPLLPLPLWRALAALEDLLPEAAYRVLGFRLFAVLERV